MSSKFLNNYSQSQLRDAASVQLVETVKTSYIDIASLPANAFSASWDYKARYFIGDDEVGNFSPVISINVIRTA